MSTHHKIWDPASGIRERLALLAALGPTVNPHAWGYHAHQDYWYFCGERTTAQPTRKTIRVTQEGSASLGLIAVRYLMTRADAMALIGHPDEAEQR